MTIIRTNFGEGGANLAPGGAAGDPDLATTLRDIADDLDGLQPAPVTSPNATAAVGANPTKAEFDAVVALVNELKTRLNAPAAHTLKTAKG